MDFNILLLTELLTQELFCVFLPEDPLYKTSSVQFHLRVTLEIFFFNVHSMNIEINCNIKVTFF